ncbi:hypothetical protein FHS78_000793 [Parvibaculum indicum]|nr:aa3-type cytochrome c oxidase subunit IV [Parvibaculum indicum]NIJ40523.1 hypothetical protein [Parvibaculum indicum]
MENKAQEGWGEEMDAQEHLATYESFITFSKYGTVAVALFVILLAVVTL